jgi:hypothetical protein
MTSTGGPRTAAGKAIVARNAIKHGATCDQVVVADELHSDWCSFLQAQRDALHPADAFEDELVTRLAHNLWKLRRLRRYELATIREATRRDEAEVASRFFYDGAFDDERVRAHVVGEYEATEAWLRFVTNTLQRGDTAQISTDDAIGVLETFTFEDITARGWPTSLPGSNPNEHRWTFAKLRIALGILAAEANEPVDRFIKQLLNELRSTLAMRKKSVSELEDRLTRLNILRLNAPENVVNQLIRHEAHLKRDTQWCIRELEASQLRRNRDPVPLEPFNRIVELES